MIKLAGTQTVSDVCRSCYLGSVHCIVNVRFIDGTAIPYYIDDVNIGDRRFSHVVYHMDISVISNTVLLDLFTY